MAYSLLYIKIIEFFYINTILNVDMKVLKHRNNWCWGHSTIIVLNGGKGIVTVSFENDNPNEATITGLSVYEKYRNKGLGTELVKLAEEEAKEFKVKRIILFSDENTFTYNWYQRLGYKRAFDRVYIESPQVKELSKDIIYE